MCGVNLIPLINFSYLFYVSSKANFILDLYLISLERFIAGDEESKAMQDKANDRPEII